MATLKEADILKHKNTVVSNMQKKDHKQLWTGLCTGKCKKKKITSLSLIRVFLLDRYEQFWAVNKKLMETSPEIPYFRYIPFRIYQPDKSFIQKLVKSVDEEGNRLTINDLLHQTIPDALKLPSTKANNSPICFAL